VHEQRLPHGITALTSIHLSLPQHVHTLIARDGVPGSTERAKELPGIGAPGVSRFPPVLRIPEDGDQRSELMSITIPK
jgi:hypothetical protein